MVAIDNDTSLARDEITGLMFARSVYHDHKVQKSHPPHDAAFVNDHYHAGKNITDMIAN